MFGPILFVCPLIVVFFFPPDHWWPNRSGLIFLMFAFREFDISNAFKQKVWILMFFTRFYAFVLRYPNIQLLGFVLKFWKPIKIIIENFRMTVDNVANKSLLFSIQLRSFPLWLQLKHEWSQANPFFCSLFCSRPQYCARWNKKKKKI